MQGYIGVPNGVMIRAILLVLQSPPVFVGVLGFGISAAIILSLIAASVHVRKRVGGKL